MSIATTQARTQRIRRIHDAFIALMWISGRRFAHLLQSFGLTKPQFVTLAALAAHKKPCTMSDLTNVTFQDAPTMTGIIDRLLKLGLVQRTRSQTDRRVVLVEVAPPGTELIKQIEEKILHDDFNGYTALTDEELTALEQLITYLLRMHVGRYMSLEDTDLDAEYEKIRRFMSDPIQYVNLEDSDTTQRRVATTQ